MSHRILLAAAALAFTAVSLPALAQGAAAPTTGNDPVIAKVNGQEVHRSDFIHELQLLGPEAQKVPPQAIYPELLKKLIATKLVSAQGYSDKLQDTKEVKDQLKNIQDQLVAEAWVHKQIQPKITDAAIKKEYDELAAKFKPTDEVRARHILVKTEAEANDIIKQLQGGADFAKLAGEKSQDPGSASHGGDLGYFNHESMVPPFADAAFAMKPGEISTTPVKTEYGYHIIKVEDKRKSAPPPLSEVKEQIANKLGQKMTNDLVENLEAKAKIEKFNLDGTPLKASADATAPAAAPAPASK